jgi:hypothetical protein
MFSFAVSRRPAGIAAAEHTCLRRPDAGPLMAAGVGKIVHSCIGHDTESSVQPEDPVPFILVQPAGSRKT